MEYFLITLYLSITQRLLFNHRLGCMTCVLSSCSTLSGSHKLPHLLSSEIDTTGCRENDRPEQIKLNPPEPGQKF